MRRLSATSALSTVLMLFAVLLVPAPAAEAKEDVRTLVQNLDAKTWKTRGDAYRKLVEKKDPSALPHLKRSLPEFGEWGQYYGVLVLDRYPARTARRTWRALAKTEVPYLRFCAAHALARQGEKGMAAVAAEALRTPGVSVYVRLWMIRRVVTRDDPKILAAQRTLVKPNQDIQVLSQLLTTYHRYQDRRVIPQVQGLIRDPRPGVRAMAAAFLYDLGEVVRAKELAAAIKVGMPARELGFVAMILSSNRRVVDSIIDALATRLGTEKNVTLLLQTIDLLGKLQNARARPALRKLVDHANDQVARRAFDVLVAMSGPVQEDTLRPLLRGDDLDRRLWAAEALRKQDDMGGIGGVVFALSSGTVAQRGTAARMLASFVMDMAVEPLLDALGDEHVSVRKAALSSLQNVLRGLFPFRTLKIEATGYQPDADPTVRSAAIERMRTWWRSNRTADW